MEMLLEFWYKCNDVMGCVELSIDFMDVTTLRRSPTPRMRLLRESLYLQIRLGKQVLATKGLLFIHMAGEG